MMHTEFWQRLRTWLEQRQRPLRLLATLGSGILILLILWYMVREFRNRGYDLWTLLQQMGWSTLGILFLLYAIALVLVIWVWGSMMGQVATPMPWRTHWYIYTITSITRRLPGSLWHVAGRTMLYQKRGIAVRAVAVVSGLEVALMMMSGAVVLLLSWPAIANHVEGKWQAILLVGGIVLGALIFLHPASWHRWQQLSGADHTQVFSPYVGLKWLLAYGFAWVVGGLMVAFLADRLYPLPLSAWPAIVAAWVLSSLLGMLIMILPSGLGVTELSLTLILSFYMPTPLAGLAALGIRFVLTLFELIFALIWWVIGKITLKK